ncbi:hypothetical protein DXC96_02260 [Enterocloster bolteae]|nr:hypothetical protein DXC96_02260 [Enterocloster bolteae]
MTGMSGIFVYLFDFLLWKFFCCGLRIIGPCAFFADREISYPVRQFPGALKDYSSAMKQKEEQVSWHPVLQK